MIKPTTPDYDQWLARELCQAGCDAVWDQAGAARTDCLWEEQNHVRYLAIAHRAKELLLAADGLPTVGSSVWIPLDGSATMVAAKVTGHCTTPSFTVSGDDFEDDLFLADDEGITWGKEPFPGLQERPGGK